MPETLSYRDSQNPWLTAGGGGGGASPAPAPGTGAGALPPNAWQGLGPGISNVRDGGDLRKWLDPKNYQNWTRDQWRAAMQFGTYNGPNSFMSELEGQIGTHAMNQHKNYFNAGGQGYLPGHFDYNTGKMMYNGIDPNLVTEVNNRAFNWSPGSTSGAPVGDDGSLGTHMLGGQGTSSNIMRTNPRGSQFDRTTNPWELPPNPVSQAPQPLQGPMMDNRSRPNVSAPGVMQNQNSTKGFGTGASWSNNKSPWATGTGAVGPKNPWQRWGMNNG